MNTEKETCVRCNYEYNKDELFYVENAYYCYDLCNDFHEGYVCKDCFRETDKICII
jgi:hypothetical protein